METRRNARKTRKNSQRRGARPSRNPERQPARSEQRDRKSKRTATLRWHSYLDRDIRNPSRAGSAPAKYGICKNFRVGPFPFRASLSLRTSKKAFGKRINGAEATNMSGAGEEKAREKWENPRRLKRDNPTGKESPLFQLNRETRSRLILTGRAYASQPEAGIVHESWPTRACSRTLLAPPETRSQSHGVNAAGVRNRIRRFKRTHSSRFSARTRVRRL